MESGPRSAKTVSHLLFIVFLSLLSKVSLNIFIYKRLFKQHTLLNYCLNIYIHTYASHVTHITCKLRAAKIVSLESLESTFFTARLDTKSLLVFIFTHRGGGGILAYTHESN